MNISSFNQKEKNASFFRLHDVCKHLSFLNNVNHGFGRSIKFNKYRTNIHIISTANDICIPIFNNDSTNCDNQVKPLKLRRFN